MKNINNNNLGTLSNELNVYKNDEIIILVKSISVESFKKLNILIEAGNTIKVIISSVTRYNDISYFLENILENDEITSLKTLEYLVILKEVLLNVKKRKLIFRYFNNKIDNGAIVGDSAVFHGITKLDLQTLGLQNSNDFFNIIKLNEDIKQFQDQVKVLLESTKDVTAEITNDIVNKITGINSENMYYFQLRNILKDLDEEINLDESMILKTGFYDSKIWNELYSFQKDAVKSVINKLLKYNGCIIADSVGLGKTFEALGVIKYFELKNYRVLILTPKKLNENWSIYTRNDLENNLLEDRFAYDVLNHTDLTRKNGKSGDITLETLNWGNYDLIVIDESHNFRNRNYNKNKETRYSKLMNYIIKSGVKTKVLLLSATPVNNKLTDLKNQLDLITEEKDDFLQNLNINSIKEVMRQSQRKINEWDKLEIDKKNTKTLTKSLPYEYFEILDFFTIARSRNHIEKYYSLDEIGNFPKRLKPINIRSSFSIPNNNNYSISVIAKELERLNLAVYTPLSYVYERYYKEYEVESGLTILGREKGIIKLMFTNLFKRLESSIFSFNKTLKSIIDSIEELLMKLGEVEFTISDYDEEDDIVIEKKSYNVKIKHMDIIRFKQDLNRDLRVLKEIFNNTSLVTPDDDDKLVELLNNIETKFNNNINVRNNKILIFSTFADTSSYIYNNIAFKIKDQFNLNVAFVSGSTSIKTTINKTLTFNEVLYCFSPKSKGRDNIKRLSNIDIDILIATDCISEGQNLQDCDYLINYDIHWNPVRIIQRFGRIDRLGSINKEIQLVNFWPNMELDEYINLENRVKSKMEVLNISSTGEENIIDENTEQMNDLEYRKQQLLQLQNEVLDLEDMNQSLSLTDFTFDDFRMDYFKLDEKYGEFKNSYGMFSVIYKNDLSPGVIVCMEDLDNDSSIKGKNPVYPLYYVYLNNDGKILNDQTEIKEILEILKLNCNDKNINNKFTIGEIKLYRNLIKQAYNLFKERENESNLDLLFSGNSNNLFGVSNKENIVLKNLVFIKEES